MHNGSRTAQSVASVRPLQIRGRFLTAVALHLEGQPDHAFMDALDMRLRQTPRFFQDAPVVIDLEKAQGIDSTADLMALIESLRARRLAVIGIQSGDDVQAQAAGEIGLVALAAGRDAPLERVSRPGTRPAAAAATPPAVIEQPPAPARLITQPVRSGQTVFADRGDLIVVGPVSSGAEVIAAGNIHIYGRLRGRALAGVNGDTSARIFCNALDAELLAIAGLYRTSEQMGTDTPRQHVQAWLDGDRLHIESLK